MGYSGAFPCGVHRKPNDERRANAGFTFERDGAPMFVNHDAARYGQTLTRATADALGREKGIEYAFADVLRDAGGRYRRCVSPPTLRRGVCSR